MEYLFIKLPASVGTWGKRQDHLPWFASVYEDGVQIPILCIAFDILKWLATITPRRFSTGAKNAKIWLSLPLTGSAQLDRIVLGPMTGPLLVIVHLSSTAMDSQRCEVPSAFDQTDKHNNIVFLPPTIKLSTKGSQQLESIYVDLKSCLEKFHQPSFQLSLTTRKTDRTVGISLLKPITLFVCLTKPPCGEHVDRITPEARVDLGLREPRYPIFPSHTNLEYARTITSTHVQQLTAQ
uniref:(California timema) hypothetical protein n=1 Tax=Timema californicum TaxID=61474 RepID=A0A7R9PAY2_TIMCA|nr:unnamed protein product [Timema californicum]